MLIGHDHVAFATFDTGIQCVFLVTAQPAEITAVGTVLIGTRHDKAQEFVPVIPFGDHSKTCSVRTQESVWLHQSSGQHVTVNVA